MEADGPNRSIDEALERDLRHRIIERPDDDSLRQIYADFWEEAGDLSRAEMIRLEIAIGRSTDPLSERHIAAEIRHDWLDVRHREWRPDTGELITKRERGLVGRLVGSPAAILERGPDVLAEHPITELQLNDFRPVDDALSRAVAALPELARIRALALGGEAAPGLAPLLESPHLAGLRSLRVMSAFEGVGSAVGLLRDLETLSLSRFPGPTTDRDLADRLAAATELGRLRSFGLIGFPAGDAAMAALARSPSFAALEVLFLDQNDGLGAPGLAAFAASPAAATLREIDLGHLSITPAIADALAALPALEALAVFITPSAKALWRADLVGRLATLDLGMSILEPGCLIGLAGLEAPRLSALELYGCELDDADIASLCETSMPALVSLGLGGNQNRVTHVERLARWAPLSRARVLTLLDAGLDDAALADLAAADLRPLNLDLSDNPFGDRGLEALIDAGVLDGVMSLDLSSTRVTDASVRPFLDAGRFPKLLTLKIRGTGVSTELEEQLAERLVTF